MSDERIAQLELIAARYGTRGSAELVNHTAGSLARAAHSLVGEEDLDVLILTGFFIPRADPPAAETDGPLGAAQLAAAVALLGGRVTVLTDAPCAPVVTAALAATGLEDRLVVAPLASFQLWLDENATRFAGTSHRVAIERVGPAVDGVMRNMRALDISAHTAPLHHLFTPGRGFRIGIGDGGNELGMGALPAEVVAAVVDQGATIRCAIDCDALVVGGTSNWAAAALVGALAVLRPEVEGLADLVRPAWSEPVLRAMVAAGAVDGISLTRDLTVDGLDWGAYQGPLAEMATTVGLG